MDQPFEDSDDFTETYTESALGWCGVNVDESGASYPMPKQQSLELAIPQWVAIPEHIDDAVSVYIDVMSRAEVAIRKAAMTAIGAVVLEHGRLPQEFRARECVRKALDDSSPEVVTSAITTSDIILRVLG
jgi:hypothetical protein